MPVLEALNYQYRCRYGRHSLLIIVCLLAQGKMGVSALKNSKWGAMSPPLPPGSFALVNTMHCMSSAVSSVSVWLRARGGEHMIESADPVP